MAYPKFQKFEILFITCKSKVVTLHVCISLSFSIIRLKTQTHSLTTPRLALSTIYLLFVDRLGRSLRFYHLEFEKESIYDV